MWLVLLTGFANIPMTCKASWKLIWLAERIVRGVLQNDVSDLEKNVLVPMYLIYFEFSDTATIFWNSIFLRWNLDLEFLSIGKKHFQFS